MRLPSKRFKDITNQNYNNLLAIDFRYTKNGKSYWSFKCKCGNIKTMEMSSIINGKRKSCGCLYKTDPKITVLNLLYNSYKKSAEKRNIYFDITKEDFEFFTNKNCFYCDRSKSNVKKYGRNKFYYNGIDRVDNNHGYSIANIVACCYMCNRAKSVVDYDDFYKWIEKTYLNLKDKGIYEPRIG